MRKLVSHGGAAGAVGLRGGEGAALFAVSAARGMRPAAARTTAPAGRAAVRAPRSGHPLRCSPPPKAAARALRWLMLSYNGRPLRGLSLLVFAVVPRGVRARPPALRVGAAGVFRSGCSASAVRASSRPAAFRFALSQPAVGSLQGRGARRLQAEQRGRARGAGARTI